MRSVFFMTGAKASNAEIALPAGYAFARLIKAEQIDTGATGSDPVNLTIVDTTPDANNEIQLVNPTTVRCYNALEADNHLNLIGEEIGERLKVS